METVREDLAKLQNLLNSISYKYEMKFKVDLSGPYMFCIKAPLKVECAHRRDGTIIDLLFYHEYPIEELKDMIQNFNHWIRRILLDIEKHELDEWLLIDGVRVFDPHPEKELA